MSKLTWYWHRLRAMSPGEMARHARKKVRQFADARRERDWAAGTLECSGAFPRLPPPDQAPEMLREALRRDADDILAGRWRAFGHLDLQVDDPPNWQCDYLVGQDLATDVSAFKLNHRDLPGGADIKLIWELSRWYQLVRLAMAAYVLDDERAAQKCVAWLEDWVQRNPPYRGWNWTSALESGLRLVQFTWIDALLAAWSSRRPKDPDEGRGTRDKGREPAGGRTSALDRLRSAILPPHVWFTWRHQSFGSSANNHLIGELAGLILATVRWPGLARWGASLNELQGCWEREVLAQFAEDGGNKEQALNYHLFSWEFCWLAKRALQAAGRRISPTVEDRLVCAGRFFWEAQTRTDPWDFGDSDSAFVSPLFAAAATAVPEWHRWFEAPLESRAIEYWLGSPPEFKPPIKRGPPALSVPIRDWWLYPKSGIAIAESGFWWVRWDLSPLGYLRTAAHGHLDALHLSIWHKGAALVIDPGTGCYFANTRLRAWLASRPAHNGPCPVGLDYPKRLGPFLWSEHHPEPVLQGTGSAAVAELALPGCVISRQVSLIEGGQRWQVEDRCTTADHRSGAFTVHWQFAPGAWVKRLGERRFSVHRAEVSAVVEVSDDWAAVEMVEPGAEADQNTQPSHTGGAHCPQRAADVPDAPERRAGDSAPHPSPGSLEGLVSPAFRKICRAPFLKLTAAPSDKPCVFRTTFLASSPP